MVLFDRNIREKDGLTYGPRSAWIAGLVEPPPLQRTARLLPLGPIGGQRICPKPMPSVCAFWRNEATVRFVSFAIFATGVLAFE